MGHAVWMKEGRTFSQPMKQEGWEQVCKKEVAQTRHLQSVSRMARATWPPGTLLPGHGRGTFEHQPGEPNCYPQLFLCLSIHRKGNKKDQHQEISLLLEEECRLLDGRAPKYRTWKFTFAQATRCLFFLRQTA